ncbi:DUF4232 domain-containing protein [Streptomyces sulphureus]|uniref:DUF4232 domain-containing protein n=1 Tax=Streptomyces sulphureus TaxID=47758 RepID=UPI001FDFDF6A|nr:DUF4232 domain-containing protein [Streptomyces sulphureus]
MQSRRAACNSVRFRFCKTEDLARDAAPDAASGRIDITMINRGSTTCSATGFAGVDIKDVDHTSSPIERGRAQPRVTNLKPGDAAVFNLAHAIDKNGDSHTHPTDCVAVVSRRIQSSSRAEPGPGKPQRRRHQAVAHPLPACRSSMSSTATEKCRGNDSVSVVPLAVGRDPRASGRSASPLRAGADSAKPPHDAAHGRRGTGSGREVSLKHWAAAVVPATLQHPPPCAGRSTPFRNFQLPPGTPLPAPRSGAGAVMATTQRR